MRSLGEASLLAVLSFGVASSVIPDRCGAAEYVQLSVFAHEREIAADYCARVIALFPSSET
jgi:hypothetical protein